MFEETSERYRENIRRNQWQIHQKDLFQTSVELKALVADTLDVGGSNGLLFSTLVIDRLDVNFFNFSISVGDKLSGDELAWWRILFTSVNDKDNVEYRLICLTISFTRIDFALDAADSPRRLRISVRAPLSINNWTMSGWSRSIPQWSAVQPCLSVLFTAQLDSRRTRATLGWLW